MRVENLGTPRVDSRAIGEQHLGGNRRKDGPKEQKSNASEAAPVLPDRDEKKRKKWSTLRHEARAVTPAAPPVFID
jgi:hypothetical protein